MFHTAAVHDFLQRLGSRLTPASKRFVLTTANPDESGPKHGIRILELETPGRLARLEVEYVGSDELAVRAANVRRLAVPKYIEKITIDGKQMELIEEHSLALVNEVWTVTPRLPARAYGPMIRIWSSSKPVVVVVGSKQKALIERHRSIAQRIASDAFTHQRLNVDVLDDWSVLRMLLKGEELGNLILVGNAANNAVVQYLEQQDARSAVRHLSDKAFNIGRRIFSEPGSGELYWTGE